MRRAGKIVGQTLSALANSIRAGKTTGNDLDALAEKLIREAGGVPSFKGYRGYPSSVCLSVNEQVVHGIPGPSVLMTGDIVGIDLGVLLDGYHADAALTVAVGRISPEAERLLRVTQEALMVGIEQARPGRHLMDIGHAIQQHAERNHFSVVRELVGHGIGRELHEEPQVPNFGRKGAGLPLAQGMTLAIEPMVNQGTHRIRALDDDWTVVTADGKMSAHFEHTVAIGKSGADVLTLA
jgi:methionyl aminopeptidase